MPRYYGIMWAEGEPPIAIGNFGAKEPKHLKIPSRAADYTPKNIPIAEEARVTALRDEFGELVVKENHPIVVRISDDGAVVEAWKAEVVD